MIFKGFSAMMITSFISDLNFDLCCLKLTRLLFLCIGPKKILSALLGIPYVEMMGYRAENNKSIKIAHGPI